jgi:hypothetical protein
MREIFGLSLAFLFVYKVETRKTRVSFYLRFYAFSLGRQYLCTAPHSRKSVLLCLYSFSLQSDFKFYRRQFSEIFRNILSIELKVCRDGAMVKGGRKRLLGVWSCSILLPTD